MVWSHIIHNRTQSITLHISFSFSFRRASVILCHIMLKENITCFYNIKDINHVSQPCCVLLLWYPKVTENLWQNCCIERLCDWFILWTQKKSVWLLTADHVAACCPEFVFCFIFFVFLVLQFPHRQTVTTVRSNLTVTQTLVFWLYIIVNACLKQSGLMPPPPGACNGLSISSLSEKTSGCAHAAILVLSPVDCAKCTWCIQM